MSAGEHDHTIDDDEQKSLISYESTKNSKYVNATEFIYSNDAYLVLSDTIRVVHWVIFCAISGGLNYSSRFAIWYLYARSFDDATETGITWTIDAGYFTLCVIGLIYPCLADKIGFDNAIIIKLFIQAIGVLGECIAMNFIFLSVFFIISQVLIIHVCLAYIAWILPHKHAVAYTSYLFSGYGIAYILGPLISGLLSHFFNYRSVFWFNFAFNVITLLLALKYIWKTQKDLESKQSVLKSEFVSVLDDKEANTWLFPVIIYEHKDKATFKSFFSSISSLQWCQLINVILQNSLTGTGESVFVVYYVVFIVDEFNASVLVATTQMFIICIGFVIGNGIIPVIINNKNMMAPFNNPNFIIITFSIAMIVLLIECFPMINDVNCFWIINIFIGFCLGTTSMAQETIILDIQPTNHAGKVSGVKGFCRTFIPCLAILITGVLYSHNTFYAFVYVVAGAYTISLCLSVLYIVLEPYMYSK